MKNWQRIIVVLGRFVLILRFPVLQEGDEGDPLSTGDCTDEGYLEGDHLPDEGRLSIHYKLAQTLDCKFQILFGRKILERKLKIAFRCWLIVVIHCL